MGLIVGILEIFFFPFKKIQEVIMFVQTKMAGTLQIWLFLGCHDENFPWIWLLVTCPGLFYNKF